MDYLILLIIAIIFVKTASYSYWEQKHNSNTIGAVSVFVLGACTLAIILRFF